MKQNQALIIIIVAVVVGGLAFFGGMQYQKSKAPTGFAGANGFQRGQLGQNGARRNGFGGATVGTIASIDNDSLTIKLMDGSSKVVDLAGSTTYSKTASGTKTDLTVGTRVAAIGSTNSDGSITAQNIQINPMFRGPGQGGGQGGRPTPTQGSGY